MTAREGLDPSAAETAYAPSASEAVAGAARAAETAAAATRATVPGRTTVLPKKARIEGQLHVPHGPRFERVRPLGAGGIGEVVLEHDHDIARRVAVKRLREDRRDPQALARFAEEIRIVGALEHPAIVPIHDVGVDETGQHYLVMRYVEGDTLEALVEKLRAGDPATTARFTIAYRVQVFASILEAVGYAHDKGVIHRDLKPANVMVGPHGEVTVMDWGIAKHVGEADATGEAALGSASTLQDRLIETQHGSVIGTPLYVSPEQAAGRNDSLGARSDVYSLGLLLHELLTLELPFDTTLPVNELLAHRIARDLDFGEVTERFARCAAPLEYVFVLQDALQRSPGDRRFADANAMLARIRAMQAGRIAIQCHVTAFKHLAHASTHWVDRHVVLYTLLLALVALAVVTGLGAAVYGVVRLASG